MVMMTPLPSKPSSSQRTKVINENQGFRVCTMKKNEGKEFNASWGNTNVNVNKEYVSGVGSVF